MSETKDIQRPHIDQLNLESLRPATTESLHQLGHAEGVILDGETLSGDLTGAGIVESRLRQVTIDRASMTGVSFTEVELLRLQAPHIDAPRSSWRNVEILGSRIGAAELYDSLLDGVHLSDSKLDLINLRSAELMDVMFENCWIGELDITGARLLRVGFRNCTLDTLSATGAKLEHVDLRGSQLRRIIGLEGLRGASISDQQLLEMAPSLAEMAGLLVR